MLSNTRNFVGALIVASVLGTFILLAALTPERVAVPFPHTINNGQEADEMVTWTTTWTSGGQPYTVTVTWRPGDEITRAEARAIFNKEVEAGHAAHPPDPVED